MSWWSEETEFIQVFGINHVLYIVIFATSLVALLFYREKVKRNRRQIALFFLTLSIIQQVVLYSWYLFETGFDVSESLPFHISRVSTLLGIWFLLTKNTKVLEVMFFFSIFCLCFLFSTHNEFTLFIM